jgi:membrane fusion protein, multidrug efflux system
MAELVKTQRFPQKIADREIGRILVFVAVVAALAVAGVYGWKIPEHVRSPPTTRRSTGTSMPSAADHRQRNCGPREDEQVVKAGDVLVRIDPRDYEVAVAKAEADLRDAEAALESSRIDIPITSCSAPSAS